MESLTPLLEGIYVTVGENIMKIVYLEGIPYYFIPGSKYGRKWDNILYLSFMVRKPKKLNLGPPDVPGLYWFRLVSSVEGEIVAGRLTEIGEVKLVGIDTKYRLENVLAYSELLERSRVLK